MRPAAHADLLAVVAACLAAALGGAGLLHVHGVGDGPSHGYQAVTVPAATAFFTASSEFAVPRDVVRADDANMLTGAAWAGLGVQLLLAGGALLALRTATKG